MVLTSSKRRTFSLW